MYVYIVNLSLFGWSKCEMAYSQHCITNWLNEISFLAANLSSFSISESGIRTVLFEEEGFFISNNIITPKKFIILFYIIFVTNNIFKIIINNIVHF